jgi:protein-tyrosine phosphatase
MPVKILMVCLGNICRSPLAEGILAAKLPKEQYIVDSAGTGSWHIGHKPDSRSIATAKNYNIDISNQKARQFTNADFDLFDYIYVMDKSNYNNVIELAENKKQKDKVQLILNEIYPNENKEVPDPYFGLENGFEVVYSMLDEVSDHIAKKLMAKQH